MGVTKNGIPSKEMFLEKIAAILNDVKIRKMTK